MTRNILISPRHARSSSKPFRSNEQPHAAHSFLKYRFRHSQIEAKFLPVLQCIPIRFPAVSVITVNSYHIKLTNSYQQMIK